MTSVPRPRASAPVMEVFASIQGEGRYLGEPQVFLRLFGCPLRCRWCDTPKSLSVPREPYARIAVAEGPARREPGFATPFQAACWIAECEPGSPRTVSVTGGEPLAYPEFLLGLRGMVGERRLHLETAGAHPRTLAHVVDRFDHVSLDVKPDFDLDAPVELVDAPEEPAPRTREEWRRARESSLALVAERDACAKLVVSGERAAADYVSILEEIERVAPRVPLYVQPATAIGEVRAPSIELVEAVAELARDRDLVVRVVPQVHRLLRIP